MGYVLLTLGIVSLLASCGIKSSKLHKESYDNITIVKNVKECRPVLRPGSIRPSVCGKCSFSTVAGQLIIKKRVGCPKYDVWRCTLGDGREFVINNVGCENSIRFK